LADERQDPADAVGEGLVAALVVVDVDHVVAAAAFDAGVAADRADVDHVAERVRLRILVAAVQEQRRDDRRRVNGDVVGPGAEPTSLRVQAPPATIGPESVTQLPELVPEPEVTVAVNGWASLCTSRIRASLPIPASTDSAASIWLTVLSPLGITEVAVVLPTKIASAPAPVATFVIPATASTLTRSTPEPVLKFVSVPCVLRIEKVLPASPSRM